MGARSSHSAAFRGVSAEADALAKVSEARLARVANQGVCNRVKILGMKMQV